MVKWKKNSEFSKVRIKPKSERPMHSNGFNDDCNVFSHVYVIKTDLTMYFIYIMRKIISSLSEYEYGT